jgi:large subunit ribosomal protein L24
MKRIRSGDIVIVTTGKSKGHIGRVLHVFDSALIVEGANLIKKNIKPNPQINEKGGILSREALINVSNVAIYNATFKKADKIGFKFLEKDGNKHKVRFYKSNNEVIESV